MSPDPEERFDRLVRLTARTLGAPVSLVTLVGADQPRVTARVGVPAGELPSGGSFCAAAVAVAAAAAGEGPRSDLFVVEDARLDPRFADDDLVVLCNRMRDKNSRHCAILFCEDEEEPPSGRSH